MGCGTTYTLRCPECRFEDAVDSAPVQVVRLPNGFRMTPPYEPYDYPLFLGELMGEATLKAFLKGVRTCWKSSCICLACGESGYYGPEGLRNVGFLNRSLRRAEHLPESPEDRWQIFPHLVPDAVRPCPYLCCLSCKHPRLLSLGGLFEQFVGFVAMFRGGRPVSLPCPRCGGRRRSVTADSYIS